MVQVTVPGRGNGLSGVDGKGSLAEENGDVDDEEQQR